jgi:hypothetical protein
LNAVLAIERHKDFGHPHGEPAYVAEVEPIQSHAWAFLDDYLREFEAKRQALYGVAPLLLADTKVFGEAAQRPLP